MRQCSRVTSSSRVRALAAALAAALAVVGGASAHGDPSTHTLESDNLYPAVASRPSQALELRLIGLLRAVAARGYPVKIALVANADDLEDATMLARPQRTRSTSSGSSGARGVLRGPLVVITPTGFGVAGRELRSGRLQGVPPASRWAPLRGLRISPAADGDALARTAPPPFAGSPPPQGGRCRRTSPRRATCASIPSRDGGLGIWLPIVLAVSFFALAWLGYELWRNFRGATATNAPG